MKSFIALAFPLWFNLLAAQSPDLSRHHSVLTTDCKSIRGHAGRIVAEAGETDLNRDVAVAHLDQIEKYHAEMEERLKIIKGLLTPAQWKLVEREHKSLETVCSTLRGLIKSLKEEFENKNPDKSTVRGLAIKLRTEMSGGNDVHERMKKKLGIL
ncbi:MAG: hypothetical protein HYW57_09875 [Ignavibacteriales bacterium]|nr:hypothetical protein [Ignavibacteriales bacterium]